MDWSKLWEAVKPHVEKLIYALIAALLGGVVVSQTAPAPTVEIHAQDGAVSVVKLK